MALRFPPVSNQLAEDRGFHQLERKLVSASILQWPIMQLRNHPLMSSNGIPNWPPEWVWANGLRNTHLPPEGEVGILDNVRRSIVRPDSCLFITIRHNGSLYLGRLAFNDEEFCRQIFELLKANCGRSLTEIGSLDIS